MNPYVCESRNADAYLQGQLSASQEKAYLQHLDACASCREQLESLASEDDIWNDVQAFLTPPTEASNGTQGIVDTQANLPVTIQQVVNALHPTDDPTFLGRMDNFEVKGVIGTGAMGVVLKAKDTSLDRVVALKVMNPVLAASGTAKSRFEREAKAAAAIHHPNVVAIHSVQTTAELPYLVMPYLKGGSLQQRVENEGPFSLVEILRVGSQIAAGLAAAHRQGVVHRDIKPSNIMLDEGVETALITDFGLARIVDDATMTRTGVISGTPEFMSPEQARGDAIDGKSDIFSLGSLLYMLATGYAPFRAQTSFGVLRKITDETPKAIREFSPDIPQWLCSLIEELHQKRPQDRPSAEQAQATLEACLAHVNQPDQVALPSQYRRAQASPFSLIPLIIGAFAMITATLFALLVLNDGSNANPKNRTEPQSSANATNVSDSNTDKGNSSPKNQPETMPTKIAGAREERIDEPLDSTTYQKEFRLMFADSKAAGELKVDMHRGSISVTGHGSDDVVVQLTIPNANTKRTIGKSGLSQVRPRNFDFDIERDGNFIKVDSNSRQYVTNVEILVPWDTKLDLDSYRDGAIQVRNMTSTVRARSEANRIKLYDLTSKIDVFSRQGSLRAEFKSINGWAGSTLESYNGSIDVLLPSESKATVKYLTPIGKVETDFELKANDGTFSVDSKSDSNLKIQYDEFVTGSINGGGSEITLETTNGNIRLLKNK